MHCVLQSIALPVNIPISSGPEPYSVRGVAGPQLGKLSSSF
jgi:hypothetical protein